MSEITYAFIDAQNLYIGVKSDGWNIDYKKFRIYLQNKYAVVKVFLFIGYIPENTVLYKSLKSFGYELIFKPTVKNSSSQREKYKGNIDAELVLHAMIEFDNYDTAIIISSDGDFYCLVDYLFQKSKLKKIITTNPKYSSLLRKFASYIEPVRNMKQSIQKK